MLTQSFIDEMKAKLLQEKQRLTEELSGFSAHTELGDSQDDNAEEVPMDEVNKSMIFRIKNDLAKIDKALAKIENGSYGMDDEGNAIDENRLRALPWADKAL